MKKLKVSQACLIVIGLYVLSSILLGFSAYRYHTSENPPLMAVGYDDLFWANTQIHIVILIIVLVSGMLFKLLLKMTE